MYQCAKGFVTVEMFPWGLATRDHNGLVVVSHADEIAREFLPFERRHRGQWFVCQRLWRRVWKAVFLDEWAEERLEFKRVLFFRGVRYLFCFKISLAEEFDRNVAGVRGPFIVKSTVAGQQSG